MLTYSPARILLPLLVLALAGCAPFYPFGSSKNGNYFGGQGNAAGPHNYVPRDIQREQAIATLTFRGVGSQPQPTFH